MNAYNVVITVILALILLNSVKHVLRMQVLRVLPKKFVNVILDIIGLLHHFTLNALSVIIIVKLALAPP